MAKYELADLFDLTGKCAVVTGAAQGIGQAIALRLSEAGANLVLAGHNPEGLKNTAKIITKNGKKAVCVTADTGSTEDLDRVAEVALTQYDGIDILVNNAGGMHAFTSPLHISEEVFHKTLNRNLTGSFFLSQRAAKQMLDAGKGGRIINIASIAGLRPDPMLAIYNASKAAVVSLTQSMARDLGGQGVLVNAVAPGPIMTPNTADVYADPHIQKLVEQRIPLGRVGEAEDIGNAVLYLSGRASENVNGSILVVDGGMLTT